MRVEVKMPRMGQSMEEGVILKWLKSPGDVVTRGEPLVEIETDKASVEIESFASGTLTEILVSEGQIVPIGTLIAIIEDHQPSAGVTVTSPEIPPKAKTVSASSQQSAPPAPETKVKPPRPKASPLARRLAQEHGIDLLKLAGTGPGGRIGKEDIHRWLAERQQAAAASAIPTVSTQPSAVRVPLSKLKQTTARRMVDSKASVPHFYVSMDIEMSRALELRVSLKTRGYQVSVNDLILKATALSLAHYPSLNATFHGDFIEQHTDVNLAIAVALGDDQSEGLLTPVISRCQALSLIEIAAAAKEAAQRARAGRLRPEDLEGGTFTVSNLGMFGVKHFEAIVNPPHAAILAVGAIRRIPVFDEHDRVIPAQMLTATVSADHRVTDGAEVARFLETLKQTLEDAFPLVSAF